MTLELTPELERALAAAAAESGTTPELLALSCLRERFVPVSDVSVGAVTLAESLQEHIGVLSSSEYVPGGAHLSTKSTSTFVDGLLQKRALGKL